MIQSKLTKFQAKDLQLYWKETPAYVISEEIHRCFKKVEHWQTDASSDIF